MGLSCILDKLIRDPSLEGLTLDDRSVY